METVPPEAGKGPAPKGDNKAEQSTENNPRPKAGKTRSAEGNSRKVTQKRKGIIAVCTTAGGLAVTFSTGILAKMGLQSLAIWVFFLGAATALYGLNSTLRSFWFEHRLSRRITGGLILLVLLGCTLAQMLVLKYPPTHAPPATTQVLKAETKGNNSPVIQAAPGSTINYGISEDTMRALLKDEGFKRTVELSERYPQGYALLGLVNGALIFEPKLKNIKVTADWNHITVHDEFNFYWVQVSSLQVARPGQVTIDLENIGLGFPKNPNTATREPLFGLFYMETLDVKKGMFLIGFK